MGKETKQTRDRQMVIARFPTFVIDTIKFLYNRGFPASCISTFLREEGYVASASSIIRYMREK